MAFAINLYFDQAAEDIIRGIWRQLAPLEKSKCLTCFNSRPHITLAIYENLDLTQAQERIARFCADFTPFQLKFFQLGIFPHHKGTIFLTPNLTEDLFKIHRHFHELFADHLAQEWDYYKPNTWHPHCTLAMETPLAYIPLVLEEILKVFTPFEITIESIGIVSLEPIEYLYESTLVTGTKVKS